MIHESINNLTFHRNEKPYGKSWEEWTSLWWQWVLSIPSDLNPGFDVTGSKFKLNPYHENVIFLVGTFGGSAERRYIIPHGKSLLVPIINFTTSFAEEPHLSDEYELKSRAKSDIDDIVSKEAILDGAKLENVEEFRVQSDVFDVWFPVNNVFGVRPGKSRGISDGYWVFLRPLPLGEHSISVRGSCSSGKTSVDVQLHLSVE